MDWFFIAIIAHFIFALVFVVDKFLLTKSVLNPLSYAFYTGLLQGIAFLLIPFGFFIPSSEQIIFSFMAGAFFTLAVFFLYQSFRLSEVSKIIPIVGGAIPVFTLLLTYFFLGERLALKEIITFCLLVSGGIIMLWPKKRKTIAELPETFWLKRISIALLSAFCFAGSFVLTKFVFIYLPFINGFIWIRAGGVLGGLLLLFWPRNWQKILETSQALKIKTISLFLSNKILGSVAFVLLNYAIFLGSVTLVNALQGAQYVFLLLIAVILSIKFPQILREQISQGILFQKIIAILFIGAGVSILAL